ncbi:hypothetical protein F5144DRAFT_649958 [Chaetomium tenue]|uniref:Uncharacterized protein n=1 Tax=Chaetomium tenue TaxID=1854479 RepID=A0ACB7PCI8_9PEZI|nr:hypothetical protein F5144DRAFT_649958 [Chaetomium globosum]
MEQPKDDDNSKLASSTSNELAQRLQMAESQYAIAKQESDRLMTISNLRSTFANRTSDLGRVQQELDNHDLLLRWALEQVPLVEAEQNEADRAKASLTDVQGRKRALNSDESTGAPEPKRARQPSPPSASPILGELDANIIAGDYRTAAGHEVRISGADNTATESKPESSQEDTAQISPKPADESPPEGKDENSSDPYPTAASPQLPRPRRRDESTAKKGPTRSSPRRAVRKVALPHEQLHIHVGGNNNDKKEPATPTRRSPRIAGIATGAVVGVAGGRNKRGGAARGRGRGGRKG